MSIFRGKNFDLFIIYKIPPGTFYDLLLLNVLRQIFHTFQKENYWPIEQTLPCTRLDTLSEISIVLAHRSNSTSVGIPPHPDTIFWLWVTWSSLYTLNSSMVSREAMTTNFIVFCVTWTGIKPMFSWGEYPTLWPPRVLKNFQRKVNNKGTSNCKFSFHIFIKHKFLNRKLT